MAQRQLQPAMFVGAAAMVVLGLAYRTMVASDSVWVGVSFLIAAVVMLVFGLIVRRLPTNAVTWVYGVVMALILAPFIARAAATDSDVLAAFAAVVAMALTTLAISWVPVLLGWGLLTLLDLAYLTPTWGAGEMNPERLVTLAAMVFGAGLLYVRIRSVNLLADLAVQSHARATSDRLTGLLNRHGLELEVGPVIAIARRLSQPVFVAYADVDGLKAVNDTYGHEAGDQLISTVAESLRAATREEDLVARVGGDEFVIVGMGKPDEAGTYESRIAREINHRCQQLDQWKGRVSIGVAASDDDPVNLPDLMSRADEELYRRRAERRA